MLKITYLILIFPFFLKAQTLLRSGPMCGTSQMKEAKLWVQTTKACEVYFEYFAVNQPDRIFQTEKVLSKAEDYFVVHLTANQVEPGQKYKYQLFLNKKKQNLSYPLEFQTPPLWQFRTEPPELTMALGSCLYVNDSIVDRPGKPYGADYHILTQIPLHQPQIMCWLGDNTYLREADWGSETGIVHRYNHTRSLPEMQKLLGSTVHFATWDDHDYGPNDSDRAYWNKEITKRMFKLFWPQYYASNQGIQSFTQWSDVDIILLDNRWNRSPNNDRDSNKTILGEEQKRWLKDFLLDSKATFKCIAMGGQFLNPVAKYENYAVFAKERQEILSFIQENNVKNVIFLTGDRHHSDLTKTPFSPVIYELTCSPLTAGPYPSPTEGNNWQVTGRHVGKRNFGILKFTGTKKERILQIQIFDADNQLQWEEKIKAE